MGPNRLTALNQVLSGRSPRQAGTLIPVAQADEDLDFLFVKIEEVHPDPLGAFPNPETYVALKRWGHDALHSLSKSGAISALDFLYILHCCMASFADGHTRMEPWRDGGMKRYIHPSASFPPFLVESVDGHWVAKTTTMELQAILGQPIAMVQGQPMEQFLRPTFMTISAEKDGYRDASLEERQGGLFLLSGLFDGLKSVEVTLVNGKRFQGATLQAQGYQALWNSVARRDSGSSYRMLNPKTAFFDYRSFDASPDGMRLIESAFRLAIDNNAENLIIDLRQNGGGNSNAGDELIRHFWSGRYRMFRKTSTRVSPELRRWYQVQGRQGWSEFEPHMGKSWTLTEEERTPQTTSVLFRGRIFVLTGPRTFSAASDFTAAIKTYRMATILGYETGGLWSCHGDVLTMNLPRSGYHFGVSFKTFYGPVEIPDEFRSGTVPDVPASERVLRPYAKEPDPLLAWALTVIEDGTK